MLAAVVPASDLEKDSMTPTTWTCPNCGGTVKTYVPVAPPLCSNKEAHHHARPITMVVKEKT